MNCNNKTRFFIVIPNDVSKRAREKFTELYDVLCKKYPTKYEMQNIQIIEPSAKALSIPGRIHDLDLAKIKMDDIIFTAPQMAFNIGKTYGVASLAACWFDDKQISLASIKDIKPLRLDFPKIYHFTDDGDVFKALKELHPYIHHLPHVRQILNYIEELYV